MAFLALFFASIFLGILAGVIGTLVVLDITKK